MLWTRFVTVLVIMNSLHVVRSRLIQIVTARKCSGCTDKSHIESTLAFVTSHLEGKARFPSGRGSLLSFHSSYVTQPKYQLNPNVEINKGRRSLYALKVHRNRKRRISDDASKKGNKKDRKDQKNRDSSSKKIESLPNSRIGDDASSVDDESFWDFSKIFDQDLFDWDARKFALKRVWRRRASAVFSVMGFVSSSGKALAADVTQLERVWIPAYEAFVNFLQTTGIDLELQSLVNRRLLDNIIILGLVQNEAMTEASNSLRDRRDDALLDVKLRTPLLTKEEALRYMKFATAAYGESMIRAAEIGRMGRFNTSSLTLLPGDDANSETRIQSRICSHCNIESEEDLVFTDVDFGGNVTVLRHFIALDHSSQEVILSIRGTFSLSELVVDVAAFSRPFCGGEAHSEMAGMAERLWESSGSTILDLLDDHPGYTLVLVGHSLGAGAAALLNILLHENHLIREHKLRCFTFACPPVFTPSRKVQSAIRSCTNFIHENDCVPFLSVDSVRHLFNCIRAIEKLDMRLADRLQLITKYRKPDPELISLVKKAHANRLEALPGAPVLTIPASSNVWLKEHVSNTSTTYDFKVCDSAKLATLGIYINPNMWDDHLPSLYEQAFQHLDGRQSTNFEIS